MLLKQKATGATLIYISTDYVFDGRKRRYVSSRRYDKPIKRIWPNETIGRKAVQKRWMTIISSVLHGYLASMVITLFIPCKLAKRMIV